jgi:outer membrane receptor protein involved in Fe transport
VTKDMTSSLTTITADQIQSLPVDNVAQVLRLNAGIVMSAGQITIRGGRTGEVAYWVDGISTTDVYNGTQGVTVENAAVQELQVVSGTFNAEYGQAMSGIINIVTKDGGSNYTGQLKIFSGSYLSTSDIFSVYKKLVTAENPVTNSNGIKTTQIVSSEKEYPLKELNPLYSGEFTLSGPVPMLGNSLKFFANGRYYKDDGYFYGVNWFLPDGIAGDSSIVSMNPYQNISLQGKLTYNMMDGNLRMSYQFFGNKWNRDRTYYPFSSSDFPYNFNAHDYLYDPYGLPKSFGDAYTHLFLLNHILSASTFYEFRISRYQSNMKQYVYKNPTRSVHWLVSVQADPTKNPPIIAETFDPDAPGGQAKLQDIISRQGTYTYVVDPNRRSGYLQPNSDGGYTAPASYSFNNIGMDPTHTDRSTTYWAGKFDITSQINNSQEIKFGSELRLHQLTFDRYQIISATDANGTVITPFAPAVPDPSSIYRSLYDRKPREFSVYVQDKMEYKQIILNLGLRYDYFDANASIPTDPADPDIYSPFKPEHIYAGWIAMPEGYSGGLNQWITDNLANGTFREFTPTERRAFMQQKVNTKTALSPRLGIAFPITDRGVIHFSYGHFFQIPQFQYLYANPDFKISSGTTSSTALFGNPDLKPQRTVMYELGLQQQLSDNIGIDLTMFYRDVRDWVGTSSVPIPTYQVGVSYAQFINKDYENVRGVTLKFERRMSDNFSFRVDYTFQIADGTYSNPTDAFNAISSNQAPVLALVPMNWDQRHTLNSQLIYSKSDWIVSLIGTYWSGQPYTPSFPRSESSGSSAVSGLTTNSVNKPDLKNVDLSISKKIQMSQSIFLELFLNVYNLLDEKDATGVYSDTGSPETTTTFRPEEISYNSKRISSPEDYVNQPAWYTAPRQIQFGITLGF